MYCEDFYISRVGIVRTSRGTMQVKERPILMTKENVQAILDGKKTQTRRVIKPQPVYDYSHIEVGFYHPTKIDRHGEEYPGAKIFGAYTLDGEWGCKCPYGQVGDRLYIKEAHYRYGYWGLVEGKTKTGKEIWRFSGLVDLFGGCFKYLENPPSDVLPYSSTQLGWYKRSPLFMPKKFARYWLEITGIRVERVQDITHEDAIAEGAEYMPNAEPREQRLSVPRIVFAGYWDSINAKRGYSWESNPWVWVIEFKVVSNATTD